MSDPDFTPDDELPQYTPEKLQWIRKRELQYAQEKLAESVGCDTKTVQRYESGESRIPPAFIRKVERLRLEEREIRKREAREAGADEIDFDNFEPEPGLALVPLVPARKLLGPITPLFAAISKALIPKAGGSGGPASPAPASGSGQARGAREGRSGRAEFRMIMGGLACLALLSLVILGVVIKLYRDSQADSRWGRSLRVARDTKVERPATPPPQRAPDESDTQQPDQVPNEIWSDGKQNGDGAPDSAGGKGASQRRSIPEPKKPYKWQKHAPCTGGETDHGGGCYQVLRDEQPPCPRYAVEDAQHNCLIPIPAEPKKPNSVEPKK